MPDRPFLVIVDDGKRETVGSECKSRAEAERVAERFRRNGVVRSARVVTRAELRGDDA